jgi:deoxyribonuclease-4
MKAERAPLLGAHMSIAGGPHSAFRRGIEAECRTIQIFTRNNVQWKAPPLTDGGIALFATERVRTGIEPVVAHANYLINLASPDEQLARKSLEALKDEVNRAELLNIPLLVLHPGSHKGRDENAGERQVAHLLSEALGAYPAWKGTLLLETTSGQGSSLGGTFASLARMRNLVTLPERVGYCLDTCHVFAAGYDIRSASAYKRTIKLFDREAGLAHLRVIHLNDSKGALGSRLDRHAHIGQGALGEETFGHFFGDEHFKEIPFILETPKGKNSVGIDQDLVNIRKLRSIAGTYRGRAGGQSAVEKNRGSH